MHSYNGNVLPSPPKEWDKSIYPNALIFSYADGHKLIATKGQHRYDKSLSDTQLICSATGGNVWDCPAGNGTWTLEHEDSVVASARIDPSAVIWASYNIYYYDGELTDDVFLAASDPTPILAPTIDPLSLFLGWKAGNWVARQRGKKKQPVAFLYNGVRLPALPEWDKSVYPYAYMYHGSNADTFAIAKRRSEPWVDGEGADAVAFYELMLYKVSDGAWVFLSNRDSMMHSLKTTDIFWVNADLYHTNGSVFLTASDPVPVYE